MAFSIKLVVYFMVLMSIFTKFVFSNDNEDFSSAILCPGNSTKEHSSNRNYDKNVATLFSKLALESQENPAFFTTSFGEGHDRAYGFYICWGDIPRQLCNKCVVYATQALLNKEVSTECTALGNYLSDSDLCLVKYANHSVTEYMEESYVMSTGITGEQLANYSSYNRTLSNTIEELIKEAGFGNWTKTNFATRVVPVVGSNEEIHVLVQCIPVISSKNCSRCLRELFGYVTKFDNVTQGGVIGYDACMLKFSNRSFIGSGYKSSCYNNLQVLLFMLFFLYFVICI